MYKISENFVDCSLRHLVLPAGPPRWSTWFALHAVAAEGTPRYRNRGEFVIRGSGGVSGGMSRERCAQKVWIVHVRLRVSMCVYLLSAWAGNTDVCAFVCTCMCRHCNLVPLRPPRNRDVCARDDKADQRAVCAEGLNCAPRVNEVCCGIVIVFLSNVSGFLFRE